MVLEPLRKQNDDDIPVFGAVMVLGAADFGAYSEGRCDWSLSSLSFIIRAAFPRHFFAFAIASKTFEHSV